MARLIKRYDNRKLYDTEASQYVSLSDIADLVRDLTAQTLTQIILEEGKNGNHAIPSDILHDLLRRSGEAIDSGIDQIRSTVDDLVQGSVGRLRQLLQSPRSRELDELRTQLRGLEQQLATLLDELDRRAQERAADAEPSTDTPRDDTPRDDT